MGSVARLVAIPVLLGVCCCGGRASRPRSLDVHRSLGAESLLAFDRNLANGDSFLYVGCDDSKSSTDVYCNVTTESVPPAAAPARVCSLKFTRRRKVAWMSSVLVEHLGRERAVLEWVERAAEGPGLYTRVALVELAGCSAVPLEFSCDLGSPDFLLGNVVVYGAGFDVIGSDEARCGSAKCRVSFDARGRQAGEPAAFATGLSYAIAEPAERGSPRAGFFLFGEARGGLMPVAHVSAAGRETRLAPLPTTSHFVTSNAHGSFGVCSVAGRLTRCVQYDPAATGPRMNLTLRLGPEALLLGLHNLEGGGMMLLTSECRRRRPDLLDCENFLATRLRGDGRGDGPRKIADHRFSCDVLVGDVQVDAAEIDGRVCFYLACLRERYAGRRLDVALTYRSACV